MYTDEPSVSLKLKKGGKVKAKKESGESHGHKGMHEAAGSMMAGAHKAFESEHGKSPKKPSMAERRKAMNPNQYAKGGKVAHKAPGGVMPMGAPQAMPVRGVDYTYGKMGDHAMPNINVQPMGKAAIAQMAPNARAARAMQVRKALTGMKKGGSADHKMISKLEKELHHHESLSCGKAHKKASGGAIDRDETSTTIEKGVKKFEKTKVNDGDRKDRAHGTGQIKEGRAAGYAKGGTTGSRTPSDTHESYNKGKTKFGETIEDNEGDYVNTQVHGAKKDKAHGTGGVAMSNAGGFKHGGKMHHKAHGGAIEHDGDWENRPANTAKAGKRNTKTGEVKEANAGGYKRGGHASKKAFATGGNVVSTGKAEKMPKHFVSKPVANTMQSGTFAKGGKVDYEEKPNLRLVKTHTGPKGHVAKVYKDRDWNEHRVKFYNPEGKHLTDSDYHTDDVEDAHGTAKHMIDRGYKRGGKAVKKFEDGGRNSRDAMQKANTKGYNATYANETADNEADAKAVKDALTYIPRKLGEFAKSAWDKATGPSVTDTKTTVSKTITPPKRDVRYAPSSELKKFNDDYKKGGRARR